VGCEKSSSGEGVRLQSRQCSKSLRQRQPCAAHKGQISLRRAVRPPKTPAPRPRPARASRRTRKFVTAGALDPSSRLAHKAIFRFPRRARRTEPAPMPDLLLELFSEEIPARMQRQAAGDLKKLVADALVERGLTYEGARELSRRRGVWR
jgi:hypothetical protein